MGISASGTPAVTKPVWELCLGLFSHSRDPVPRQHIWGLHQLLSYILDIWGSRLILSLLMSQLESWTILNLSGTG